MRRALHVYYRSLQVLLTLLMGVLIVPVLMQVLSRYVGFVPRYIWTEEIARFCFVWVIMLGAMIAVRDGTHFEVDLLPHRMSRKAILALSLFVHLAIFLVALVFVLFGYDFLVLGARQQSEISGLPMVTIYAAWPIAGITWILFLGERLADDIHKYRAAASV